MATRKFQEIANEIRSRVLSLRYGLEGGLPETRDLAKSFGCSINTVSTALAVLESQRLIVKRGHTFYVDQYAVYMSDYLPMLTQRAPSGKGYYRNVGDVGVVVPPDLFQIKLGLHPQDTAVFRMQVAGEVVNGVERPLQLTYRYYFCDLSDGQVSRMREESLYQPLLHENKYATRLLCIDELTPRMATEGERELLFLPVNTPVTYLFEVCRSSQDELLMAQEVILPPNESLIFSFAFTNRSADKE